MLPLVIILVFSFTLGVMGAAALRAYLDDPARRVWWVLLGVAWVGLALGWSTLAIYMYATGGLQ